MVFLGFLEIVKCLYNYFVILIVYEIDVIVIVFSMIERKIMENRGGLRVFVIFKF